MQHDTDLIEAFLSATEGMSQTEAAKQSGVSQKRVSDWRRGDRGRLRQPTRQALIRFLEGRPKAGEPTALVEEGLSDEEQDIPAPNYDSLGIELPGYERLHERPRREFDRFMLELIASGLGREDLEELGRGLLAPIAHLNTLHKGKEESDARSEEDQMLIMNGMIPVLRKIIRERGRR